MERCFLLTPKEISVPIEQIVNGRLLFDTKSTVTERREDMLQGYKDILTLEEFALIIRKGRRSAVKVLKESGIKYRVLRGSYRISKESVIEWIRSGGE